MADRIIYAIDPGPETSGWVVYDGTRVLESHAEYPNDELCRRLRRMSAHQTLCGILAVEWIECRGMPVGQTTLRTCMWVGRFVEAWGGQHDLIPATRVRIGICGSAKARKSNVRQALIDLHGGSRQAACGTKKQPGPLYGVSDHAWSALAVAVVSLRGDAA